MADAASVGSRIAANRCADASCVGHDCRNFELLSFGNSAFSGGMLAESSVHSEPKLGPAVSGPHLAVLITRLAGPTEFSVQRGVVAMSRNTGQLERHRRPTDFNRVVRRQRPFDLAVDDQVGPFGKDVEDAALLLEALAGHDPLDSTSASVEVPRFRDSLTGEIKGLKLGVPRESYAEGMEKEVEEAFRKSLEVYSGLGAEIIEIELPRVPHTLACYYVLSTAEASSNLARYDGVKYGLRSREDPAELVQMYEGTRQYGFGTEVKRRIMLGTYALSAGYYDAYYLKAQKARTLIKEDFDRAFKTVDCLITPVSPSLPFKIGEKITEPLQMYLVDIYTVSLNLSGLPGMSINCGSIEGLPVGLQIIGRAFDEVLNPRLRKEVLEQ